MNPKHIISVSKLIRSIPIIFCLFLIPENQFDILNVNGQSWYESIDRDLFSYNNDWLLSEEFEHLVKPIDDFLNNVIPPYVGLPSRDINGTASEFRASALSDDSNDDAVFMTAQELLKRSGFDYEIHEAIADDGYITPLCRIINPFADRSKLYHPPVMIMHGGLIDTTAYLIASSIQHFPEKWPRLPNDFESGHKKRSSNRSLAMMLANNGFDVWLVETRGANEYNMRHIKTKALESAIKGKNNYKNITKAEAVNEIGKQWDYWAFTEDDIIKHEIKAQMDKIMEVTKSETLSLFVYSLSTRTSLAFLSTRPDYAKKLRAFVLMSPITSGEGMGGLGRLIIQDICPLLPTQIGRFFLTEIFLTPQFRTILVDISRPKWLRYILTKFLVSMLVGSSAKYQTNLELNVISHLFLHLSYKMVKQMCQSMLSDQFQKFDYGFIKNQILYKSAKPPAYDLSNLQIEDYITITATNDNFATEKSYEHLMKMINPKPLAHYRARGFSHLDLFAGFRNDYYVNLPVLGYLIRKSYIIQVPKSVKRDIPEEITNSLDINRNISIVNKPSIHFKINSNVNINDDPSINNNANYGRRTPNIKNISIQIGNPYDNPKNNNDMDIKNNKPASGDISYESSPSSTSRTFKLPFLDFKPENIIESSSQDALVKQNLPNKNEVNPFDKFNLQSIFESLNIFKLPVFGGSSKDLLSGGGDLSSVPQVAKPLFQMMDEAKSVFQKWANQYLNPKKLVESTIKYKEGTSN